MKLRQLLEALPNAQVKGNTDLDITAITADSRQVRPGALFVAYRGVAVDGHAYIPDALRQGAAAVVGEREPGEQREAWNLEPFGPSPLWAKPGTPCIHVPDGRLALAQMAAAWHDFPSRKLKVIGVTGTDGKTTTCMLIQSILQAAGHATGMVSTVSARIGDEEVDTGFHTTTPDALELQGYLARMVSAGMEYALLETTSHGLDQQRVAAVDYDVAVLTNITHEHLDQHGSFEGYKQAKAKLFRYLSTVARKEGTAKVSILNADDASFDDFCVLPADLHLSYGLSQPADLTAQDLSLSAAGVRFVAVTPKGDLPVASSLPGRFNVSNILAAIAVGISQDLPLGAIQEGIAAVKGVIGRMERITLPVENLEPGTWNPPDVIVDFAHTPNALEQALVLARTLTKGRVIAVYGCAGLRDRGKRPLMGAVSGRLADLTVITAEDPRTESLDEIMAQIAAGCEQAGRREGEGYIRVGDRGEAIAQAIALAGPGDLVLICGKGHERSLCFGSTEYPWSDQEAARKGLGQRAQRAGEARKDRKPLLASTKRG